MSGGPQRGVTCHWLGRTQPAEPTVCAPSTAAPWIPESFQLGQRKLPAASALVRACALWLPTPSDGWSWGHVRGWLECGLQVQGGCAGKPAVCVGRSLGLGGLGLGGWEGLPGPVVASPFLSMRLLSSCSSCSSRDPWGLLFEGGPGGGSGGLSSQPRMPVLERRGWSEDFWLATGVSCLAVCSCVVEEEEEVSLVSSGKAPTSSYTGSSYTGSSASSCSSTDPWDDFIGWVGMGWKEADTG